MILSRDEVEYLNLASRLRGAEVSPLDKQALAQMLGVSVRTVQRWFAPVGGQYRRLVPLAVAGRDWALLTPLERARLLLGVLLADWHERYAGLAVAPRVAQLQFATLADCLRWADALAEGLAPVWLTCNWRREVVRRRGLLWEVRICYEGERVRKRRGVDDAYRGESAPPRRRDESGEGCEQLDCGQDCPGDDLRRECCLFESRASCRAKAERVCCGGGARCVDCEVVLNA